MNENNPHCLAYDETEREDYCIKCGLYKTIILDMKSNGVIGCSSSFEKEQFIHEHDLKLPYYGIPEFSICTKCDMQFDEHHSPVKLLKCPISDSDMNVKDIIK